MSDTVLWRTVGPVKRLGGYVDIKKITQWPKEKDRKTDNTMAKRKRQKNRQHNGQKKKTEEQTTQWPKEKDIRTENKMAKRKRRVVCSSISRF
jgi:hypothetical protein